MKRIFLCFIVTLILMSTSFSSFALTRDYYISDKSVIYQVHHTVMKWNSHDDYRFVKYFPENSNPQYWIAIELNDSNTIFSDKSTIIIDGKTFVIQKRSFDELRYYTALRRSYFMAFYDLSDDIIIALQNATSVEIKYALDSKEKPITWKLTQGKLKEFKDVIGSNRDKTK
ncbi:exported hypothetical protein [uncultured Sporomusa sp.]|uniref:Uncharacterized protein n=1 Tax=uncultured Sporomusa sp. TaxID=307249 RepID=A0A212LZX2_9FIRM|nr:hypothetical protein [uncultured Sporomusa sp.]SCM83102.1 exported hypothetical protein [uncultured Sporomusa sp.]